ncbi:hypothetical protein [Brachyspira hyodysenteriae]|uniref:hypothetical protein n=1 Tax=Brachyspira hyodysenteriae TaxID=159 RepID=UPI00118367B1|nr:hypothetical protein [Brachyspira hyodysenteriae]
MVEGGLRQSVTGGTARVVAWCPKSTVGTKTGTAQTAKGKEHSWVTILNIILIIVLLIIE